MPKVKLDLVQNCEITETATGKKITRMANVSEMIGNPATMADRALYASGVPQIGDVWPGGGLTVSERRVSSVEAGDVFRVTLTYTSPPGIQFGANTFVVTDGSTLQMVPSQLLPGKDRKPFKVNFRASDGSRRSEVATVNTPLPMRTLTMEGVLRRQPSMAALTNFARVNKKEWQGLPAGYWLYAGIETRTADLGKTYYVRAVCITKQVEDWSTGALIRDPFTQKILPVRESQVATLFAKPYAFGIDDSVSGIARICAFETADFRAVFGV